MLPGKLLTYRSQSILILLALTVAFVTIRCAAQPTEPPASPTASPTPTAQPTKTPTLIPTETNTPEPTPTTPPYTRCQEIIDAQLPQDFLTEGSIIFSGECEGKAGLYKLSAATRKIVPFLNRFLSNRGYYTNFNVSNDQQWLAIGNPSYDTNGEYLYSTIVIVGEDDSSVIEYAEDRTWDWVYSWHNNVLGIKPVLYKNSVKYILNPFTGKISSYYFHPEGLSYDLWISFDPFIAYAVYGNGNIGDEYTSFLLNEIATGHIIWQDQTKTHQGYASDPEWSPNGKYFSIAVWQQAASFKFLAVDRNGHETLSNETFGQAQETWFNKIYSQWSSKGKYLAFWSKVAGKEDSELTLWLPETNDVIHSVLQQTRSDSLKLPKFSPDEQELIVHTTDENNNGINSIVDISSGEIARLGLDLSPLAWIKTDQELVVPSPNTPSLPSAVNTSVKQTCPEIQSAITAPKYDGELVFFRDDHLYRVASNLGIQKLTDTEFQVATTAIVSPNQKWLFYWYEDDNWKRHYWLYSLTGQPSEVITNQIDSEYVNNAVSGWQNNDELQIGEYISSLFNPFTKKTRAVPEFKRPKISNCINDYCGPKEDARPWRYLNYDNSFERSVFVDYRSTLVMQDRDGKVLWQYTNDLADFNMPQWSPDEQKLGAPLPKDEFGEHYEIFTVDRNGRQRQLTNYSAAYPTMTIDKFSWSPDGRYIAFWGDTHSQEKIAQQNPYRLFVLDTVTRQTVDYCVEGDYVSQYSNHRAPVWSPDSSQIAVNGFLDGKRQILIVDLMAETVYPMAEGELVGWMTMP